MNVFIIVNEWEHGAGSDSEVVGTTYFASESDAWDALRILAEAYHLELGHDETSFVIDGPEGNSSYEEYYIQELTKG